VATICHLQLIVRGHDSFMQDLFSQLVVANNTATHAAAFMKILQESNHGVQNSNHTISLPA
jgi:hypothetical protein